MNLDRVLTAFYIGFDALAVVDYHGSSLTSPLTGRRCAHDHISIEQEIDGEWYEVIREEKSVHLAIAESSGSRSSRDWDCDRLRFREGLLEEGEMIAVFGFGSFDLDADGVTEGASEDEAPLCACAWPGPTTTPS